MKIAVSAYWASSAQRKLLHCLRDEVEVHVKHLQIESGSAH